MANKLIPTKALAKGRAKAAPAPKATPSKRPAPLAAAVPAPQAAGAAHWPKGHPMETWRTLNAALTTISEEDAWAWLKAELEGPARVQLILRLYGRGNKLRAARERKLYLGGGKDE